MKILNLLKVTFTGNDQYLAKNPAPTGFCWFFWGGGRGEKHKKCLLATYYIFLYFTCTI